MKVVHALERLEKSIFLAGPTPRDVPGMPTVPSWRPEAIAILQDLGFTGSVFVPEPKGKNWSDNYDDQVTWEWEAIHQATITVFWVPRELKDMPAFTTNVEYGLTAASSRLMIAWPPGTPKMGYLEALARRYSIPMFTTLPDILKAAVERSEKPFG